MQWKLAIAAAVVSISAAQAADDATKRDIAAWQGTWRAVSLETDGKQATPEELKKISLTVQGTGYHFQNGSFSEHGSYRFKADENPKQLDIVVGEGKDKGKTYLVIYKVVGDELTICLETANKRRPSEFTGRAGSGQVLEVWRRAGSLGSASTAAKSEFARSTIDLGMVVKDLERSLKFYTEAIGFQAAPGFFVDGPFGAEAGLTDGKPLSISVLVLGDGESATRLKLMQVPGAANKPLDTAHVHSQLGYRYLTIYVADRAAALARLKKAGVKPLGKGTIDIPASVAPGVALTVVRDPDGNFVELISPQK